jgi:hypothetical protein
MEQQQYFLPQEKRMAEQHIIRKVGGKWENTKAWKKQLDSLPDGNYKVTIVSTKKRSLQQNAWFHCVLPEIRQALRDAGYDEVRTDQDAKDVVKSLFFKKTVSNGIEDITVIEGTSEQSKVNFAEKADEIIRWASEYLGIDVAPPETQLDFKI